jgi:glutamyl-Q tRNA(Asp) synthetase
MNPPLTYRGRFAPTPSGPLHLGSLLTALASFLHARKAGGSWLLRLDDLDRPRCVPGADTVILRQLEAHGLHWDESPYRQSAHRKLYSDALATLLRAQRVYRCVCTRARLNLNAVPGPDGPVYAGTCRDNAPPPGNRNALRLRVTDDLLCVDDALQGRVCRKARSDIGDFVVHRADGVPGYQLACAVDEANMRISHVVRGADLLGSTLRQRAVQLALELPVPEYAHLPVLVTADGRKLSKQNHAVPVQEQDAANNLWHCLAWLGQSPPVLLQHEQPADILAWTLRHWDWSNVPRSAQIVARIAPAAAPL